MTRLWIGFGAVMVLSFAVLGWIGTRIYQEAPPIPDTVATADGRLVIEPGEIAKGQNVWQSLGGMEVGSIWGHGSYTAPDWTADYLHREAVFILDAWAQEDFHKAYDELELEQQAQLRGRLESLLKNNRLTESSIELVIHPLRAAAFESNLAHYTEVFSGGNTRYAIPRGALSDSQRLKQLTAFFFWTSWAAVTNRPNDDITYTHNWPHEPLVGNRPTGESVVWTGVSIIMLL